MAGPRGIALVCLFFVLLAALTPSVGAVHKDRVGFLAAGGRGHYDEGIVLVLTTEGGAGVAYSSTLHETDPGTARLSVLARACLTVQPVPAACETIVLAP